MWNYLSIPKLQRQRLHRWSLWCIGNFHPTLYNGCNCLSMLVFKLKHASKRGPCCVWDYFLLLQVPLPRYNLCVKEWWVFVYVCESLDLTFTCLRLFGTYLIDEAYSYFRGYFSTRTSCRNVWISECNITNARGEIRVYFSKTTSGPT